MAEDDKEKAPPARVRTMRKGSGVASSPNRLPPFSLLGITAFSWNWSRVPVLDLLEMIAFLLDDGGHGFFSRLLRICSSTGLRAGVGAGSICDGSCLRADKGQCAAFCLTTLRERTSKRAG